MKVDRKTLFQSRFSLLNVAVEGFLFGDCVQFVALCLSRCSKLKYWCSVPPQTVVVSICAFLKGWGKCFPVQFSDDHRPSINFRELT